MSTTTNPCPSERVIGAPLLGICSKPKNHTTSFDPAQREHCDEQTGQTWTVST